MPYVAFHASQLPTCPRTICWWPSYPQLTNSAKVVDEVDDDDNDDDYDNDNDDDRRREREGVTLHVEQIVEVVVECSEQRNFCEQQISRAEQLRAAANPAELATDLQLKSSTSLQSRKSFKWWQPDDTPIIHLTTSDHQDEKKKIEYKEDRSGFEV